VIYREELVTLQKLNTLRFFFLHSQEILIHLSAAFRERRVRLRSWHTRALVATRVKD